MHLENLTSCLLARSPHLLPSKNEWQMWGEWNATHIHLYKLPHTSQFMRYAYNPFCNLKSRKPCMKKTSHFFWPGSSYSALARSGLQAENAIWELNCEMSPIWAPNLSELLTILNLETISSTDSHALSSVTLRQQQKNLCIPRKKDHFLPVTLHEYSDFIPIFSVTPNQQCILNRS